MAKGEGKGLSVFMPTGMWAQVTGTESHEPSGYVPFIERQLADVSLIHHILTIRMWENVTLQA